MATRASTRASIFRGVVEGGQLRLDDPQRWRRALHRADGKRMVLRLERDHPGRSLDQNRYYWGVCVEAISDWTGYEREEVHEICKAMFLGTESKVLPVGHVEVPRSTRGLSTAEFSDYVDRVRRWAAGHGVYIPGPDEPPEVRL